MKQEAQRRSDSLVVPVRSVVCRTSLQKQVGQTIVQLVQARQVSAISSQPSDSSCAMSRSRRPSVVTPSCADMAARAATVTPVAA